MGNRAVRWGFPYGKPLKTGSRNPVRTERKRPETDCDPTFTALQKYPKKARFSRAHRAKFSQQPKPSPVFCGYSQTPYGKPLKIGVRKPRAHRAATTPARLPLRKSRLAEIRSKSQLFPRAPSRFTAEPSATPPPLPQLAPPLRDFLRKTSVATPCAPSESRLSANATPLSPPCSSGDLRLAFPTRTEPLRSGTKCDLPQTSVNRCSLTGNPEKTRSLVPCAPSENDPNYDATPQTSRYPHRGAGTLRKTPLISRLAFPICTEPLDPANPTLSLVIRLAEMRVESQKTPCAPSEIEKGLKADPRKVKKPHAHRAKWFPASFR
jgi:hypothetical protein